MDSCQLGLKINMMPSHSPILPLKSRSTLMKKCHSSSPSPEVSKRNNSNNGRSAEFGMTQNEIGDHLSKSQSNASVAPVRNRATHSDQRADKRRRPNSSPVRPWKSPSPPSSNVPPACESNHTSSPNLLRHISVIRETPPILKPQVVTASSYHAHPYHHLVDQYAAAYHLYKTGPSAAQIGSQVNPTPSNAHHWGAYG